MENFNAILVHLLNHSENEVVEFKAAKNNYDVDDLGKYFSALSNEANLREHDFAWIVFGIDNKTHAVTGTSFKEGEQALNKLKQDMSQHTTDNRPYKTRNKNVKITNGPDLPIKEVVSFTHTYAGEVVDSEHVIAKGKVEKVIKNSKDSHYRLVVGTTREAVDEYLKLKKSPC